MEKTKVTKDLENKTLIIERSFTTTPEKLWSFYSTKELFEKWWGPEGWETTTKEFNFKPGGRIHYSMKCVDKNQGEWFGQESWGLMEIQTVSAPTSFSVKDYFSDAEGSVNTEMPAQKFTVELVAEGDQTRLITRSITDSAEQLEQLVAMGMVQGFNSQMNKLEKLLQ